LKSEGFCVLATKKTSLALHIYWTTTPKDGRIHDFWFVEGRACVSSLMPATPLSFVLLHSLSLSLCSPFFPPNDASIRLQWQLLLHLSAMVAIFWQYSAATNNPPLFSRIQLSSLKNHISLIWNYFWLKFGVLICL
jgi:hypothetical protein